MSAFSIHAHLTFNGNCREAMFFYQQCFGGNLRFQTVGESPQSDKLSARMKKCIVLATLAREGLLLLGSDLVSNAGLIKGNAVTLTILCTSQLEFNKIYSKLSTSTQTQISSETKSGRARSLIDPFGHHWMLLCKTESSKRKS